MQQRHLRHRILVAVAAATLAIAFGAIAPAAAAAPKLKADYRFQISFDSSVAGARHLDPIPVSSTVYTSEKVKGRTVLVHKFNQGDGLDLAAASTVFPYRQYTIVVLMRFDSVDSFRRIVDFSNGSEDYGLYVDYGLLDMYDYDAPVGEIATIAPGKWVQVVVTRSLAGRMKGYVDGVRQFSYDDAVNKLGVVSADDHLIFFNDGGGLEESAGAVARIRLYNGPLTDDQVAHLTTTAPPQSVSTSRSSASRSSTITVSGRNYSPHEFVYVTLKDSNGQSHSLAGAKANGTGSFSIAETIPARAHVGGGSIIALGQWSGLRAKVHLSIH
jgi:hypothetical protein